MKPIKQNKGNEEDFRALSSCYDKVKYLLECREELRNDDMKLVSKYYFYEIGKQRFEEMTAYDLMSLIYNSKLPSFKTIDRTRRKVQLKYPSLNAAFPSKERKPTAQEIITLINKK